MDTKTFHIGDVLSAATGRLVSPTHMGGVVGVLNWMTGESLMTHQLPRAMEEVSPLLRETFPDLTAVEIPTIDSQEACDRWLATLYPRFGEMVDVPRLPTSDHTSIDPIAEIKMMRPDLPIIVVDPDQN